MATFAKSVGATKLFDAGDVQANGFQIIEDDNPFETFTDVGASYMGYAASALLAAAIADRPAYAIAFSGDGSFMMNPQILVDAVQHGLRATLVIFDNRRMGAISRLQFDQYGAEFRTSDGVAVDYVRMASAFPGVLALTGGDTAASLRSALETAFAHRSLSVIHVPVDGGMEPVARWAPTAIGMWEVGSRKWKVAMFEQTI